VANLERPLWVVARMVVLYPGRSTALAVAVTATTPATLREVTGVVVGGCAAIGMRSLAGGGWQMSQPSLHEIAKFRKRRNLVRRRWVAVMADCALAKASVNGTPDKRRPLARKITREALGVAVLVDGSRVSAGPDAFGAVADKLRAGFKCKTVKIEPAGPNVLLHLRYEEPRHFSQPISATSLPPSRRPLHVTVGLDEDGQPVEKDLRLPHLFIGAQGAGKSSEMWVILHRLLASGTPVRLWVFDPKGGMEFALLEKVAWRYEDKAPSWPLFLEHASRAMSAKRAALRSQGIHELTTFTEEFPLDVMVIDELLTAIAHGKGANRKTKVDGAAIQTEDAFTLYLSTARAAGGTALAASQLMQKENIGTVRDLFSHITCLRVASPEIAAMALGSAKLYPAHQLPSARHLAGQAYAASPDGRVVKYRGAYPNDALRRQVARRVGVWTRRLGREAEDL
jgi:S-DNA-T family DNA segregation ATPase FtsK/SpoIIIE